MQLISMPIYFLASLRLPTKGPNKASYMSDFVIWTLKSGPRPLTHFTYSPGAFTFHLPFRKNVFLWEFQHYSVEITLQGRKLCRSGCILSPDCMLDVLIQSLIERVIKCPCHNAVQIIMFCLPTFPWHFNWKTYTSIPFLNIYVGLQGTIK